jgi:hypothetical protein
VVAAVPHRPLLDGATPWRKSRPMDPTRHGTRGCWRLVTRCHMDEPGPPTRAGMACNGGQRSPDHRARKLHQQTPTTVISMTSALHPKGQPGAAHRPTQARSYHANVPANRRTPRPPNGVEQQPGRSPDPKAPSSTRAVGEGVYPFKHCPIASFELEQDQPPSARARCPVGGHGRCASVLGRCGRNRVRPV